MATSDSGAATVTVDEPESTSKSARSVPRSLPPYAVVVLNDDAHSFAYVVEGFQKVFRYPAEKALGLAMHIHAHGRGVVWSGCREVAELKRDQLRALGPDFYAQDKVEWPLGVLVEPLPG